MKISVSPNSSLSSREQVEDLRLDRDVERRHRLVADDQLGLGDQRPGDADALRLPARELVRIAVDHLGQQPDRLHHLDAPALRRSSALELGHQRAQRIGDDLAHRHARIERGQRVLEDDLQVARAACASPRRGSCVRSSPSHSTRPSSGVSSCRMQRPSVDLPQPLSPTMPSVSPGLTENEMSSSAFSVSGLANRPRRRSRRSS